MLKYPSITILQDLTLFHALRVLDPPTFKLFVYLHHCAQIFEDPGCGYELLLSTELEMTTKLDSEQLMQSFITLRGMDWIQGFSASMAEGYAVQDREKRKQLIFRWCMNFEQATGLYNRSKSVNLVEHELPRSQKDCEDFLVIGTWWVPLDPKKERNRRKHTGAWLLIRKQVLERDCHQCTECGSAEDLHVHHLTYENEGNEKLEDLVALCSSCHGKVKNG